MAKSAAVKAIGQRKGVAQRPAKQPKKSKYAPEPTIEEYKTFPPGFRLEHDIYPAVEILKTRYSEKRREYLVRWHPHPLTRQEFEPTWVSLSCGVYRSTFDIV